MTIWRFRTPRKMKIHKMYSLEELQDLIRTELEKRIAALKIRTPRMLYAPVNYSLEMGGKRLRPVMLLVGYHLFRDDIQQAIPAALAIEVFHNFTLLHDDIMDKAAMRRNRETVHRVFGENAAILSGDVMAFLSYNLLLETKSEKLKEIAGLFTQTAIEVCEGQQMDMDFESRMDVTETEYLEMIRLKTAVLLACGLKAGALLANAGEQTANLLYDFGINLGLAFQLQDDWLDTFGNSETFGKKIGGDILSNKKTFLLIKALENAGEPLKTTLKGWIERTNYIPEEKIMAVTGIYNQLKIGELAQQKEAAYFEKARQIYETIPVEEKRKKLLAGLSQTMLNRVK